MSVFVLATIDNYDQFVVLDRVHISSVTGLTTSDYSILGQNGTSSPTTMSTLSLDITFATTSQYADFPLNTAGINNISATSTTAFVWRLSADFDNVDPTAQSNTDGNVRLDTADGGGNPIKLLLNYCDLVVATAPSIESEHWFD